MKQQLRRMAADWRRQVPALVVLAALGIWSCSATPGGGTGPTGKYNLRVILEKNADLTYDYAWVQFWRDDAAFAGAQVIVEGDTITLSATTGQGTRAYPGGRWNYATKVHIAAVDTSQDFVYRDSVVIPDGFHITDVIPPSRLWQGGRVTMNWSSALGVRGYGISVKPRTAGSAARGIGDTARVAMGETSYSYDRTAFENLFGQLVPDVYDMQVIGYTPNLLIRPGALYNAIDTDVPSPIATSAVSGAISALVVTARDTVLVPQSR